jgi:hypothetical protein
MSNVGEVGGGVNAVNDSLEKTTKIHPSRNSVVNTYCSVSANKKLKAL